MTIDSGGGGGTEPLMRFVTYSHQADSIPALTAGVDYRLTYTSGTGVITVDLLDPGLRKMEAAITRDPSAYLRMDYDTTVEAEGNHGNQAVLYPGLGAIRDENGISDTTSTKWGSLSVSLFDEDDMGTPIPGATFELYLTAQDAMNRQNRVVIDGRDRWTTDDNGRLTITGLRFSEFVNGVDRDPTDPLFRNYWVVPVSIPRGWDWVEGQPLGGSVNADVHDAGQTYVVARQEEEPGADDDPRRPGWILGWILDLWDFGSSVSADGNVSGVPVTPEDPAQPGDGDLRSGDKDDPQDPTDLPTDGDGAETSSGGPAEGITRLIPGRENLASTGAQVIGLVMVGSVLVVAGALLLLGRRHRKEEQNQS